MMLGRSKTYPVLELLLADGLNTLFLVERVPELGDDEEVLTLYDALLDSTGNTLTRLLLVSVVCKHKVSVYSQLLLV